MGAAGFFCTSPTHTRDLITRVVVFATLARLAASASAQPVGQPDSTRTQADADSMLFHRSGVIAATVGRPSSLRGRFASWCLADIYRNVAASTSDSRIASAARRAAAGYERAAPPPEEYTAAGFTRGRTVTASLVVHGTCTTIVR